MLCISATPCVRMTTIYSAIGDQPESKVGNCWVESGFLMFKSHITGFAAAIPNADDQSDEQISVVYPAYHAPKYMGIGSGDNNAVYDDEESDNEEQWYVNGQPSRAADEI